MEVNMTFPGFRKYTLDQNPISYFKELLTLSVEEQGSDMAAEKTLLLLEEKEKKEKQRRIF